MDFGRTFGSDEPVIIGDQKGGGSVIHLLRASVDSLICDSMTAPKSEQPSLSFAVTVDAQ